MIKKEHSPTVYKDWLAGQVLLGILHKETFAQSSSGEPELAWSVGLRVGLFVDSFIKGLDEADRRIEKGS